MDFNSTMIKFYNGECNAEELRIINEWIDADPAHADALFRLESLHHRVQASTMNAREVSHRLRGLHRRIEAANFHRRRMDGLRTWLRRAAVIAGIIVLGTAVVWFAGPDSPVRDAKMSEAIATGDKPRVVRLADGTSVWLKAGSRLRYPAEFKADVRRVELCGEGYFEVAKNKHRPFVVTGGPVDVQVLGTKFDFFISGNKQLASVSLIEGSVEVRDVKREGRLLLKPRQRVMINTVTGQQNVENMDTRLVAAWHNRLIPFTNANVNDIARTLEQLYGVHVQVADNVDVSRTFSGAVSLTTDVDSVLALIKSTVPIRYYRKGNTVWIEAE